MKIYKDVEQGTEDWHKLRFGKIGGTRSKGLFIKSDNLLLELLSEITEEFTLDEDGFTSSAMQRGNDLEPQALEELRKYTGINFETAGWIQSLKNPLIGISPDGISEDLRFAAEIKCPESKKHIKTILSGEIPDDNLNQCLHYFIVNDKLEKLFFCSYRPEAIKQIFVKELTRESLVNIGTNSKPIIKSVNNIVIEARSEADKLLLEIEEKIEQLKF